jgi:hypothetical protein
MSEPIGLGRGEAVNAIAELVEGVSGPHPTRIAIDGPDAAGKTTPADELAEALRERGREVVRASIDGFHRPRSERCRQGPESPLGCYEDSFDYERIRAELLEDAADAVLIRRGLSPSARARRRLGSPYLRQCRIRRDPPPSAYP